MRRMHGAMPLYLGNYFPLLVLNSIVGILPAELEICFLTDFQHTILRSFLIWCLAFPCPACITCVCFPFPSAWDARYPRLSDQLVYMWRATSTLWQGTLACFIWSHVQWKGCFKQMFKVAHLRYHKNMTILFKSTTTTKSFGGFCTSF